MRAGTRLVSLILVAALIGAACTQGSTPSAAPSTRPSRDRSGSPVPVGPGSAAEAMAALCVQPKSFGGKPKPAGNLPAEIAEVEHEVETVRGLTYDHPVAAEAVSAQEMSTRVTGALDTQYPRTFFSRRTEVWRTIGVIPSDADLREALLRFGAGAVIGYYNPTDEELVYTSGGGELGFSEKFALAHELTHAIDDQHFDLSRLDDIAATCRDETFTAALGAVEGSAQFFATEVLTEFPASIDFGDLGNLGASVEGVPPFVTELEYWPYIFGQAFIGALDVRGGTRLVNRAIRRFPRSTEQVIHPERYPNDRPQPVDVPDLAPSLGLAWDDLDVMQVGEEWLRAMFRLRLSSLEADAAAAGWDGGLYRAWTDGERVAVVLRTVWDSAVDAEAFAGAIGSWLDAGGSVGSVRERGTTVDVSFASDGETLDLLNAAL